MIDAFYWQWTLSSEQAFHLNTSEAVSRPLENAVSDRTKPLQSAICLPHRSCNHWLNKGLPVTQSRVCVDQCSDHHSRITNQLSVSVRTAARFYGYGPRELKHRSCDEGLTYPSKFRGSKDGPKRATACPLRSTRNSANQVQLRP